MFKRLRCHSKKFEPNWDRNNIAVSRYGVADTLLFDIGCGCLAAQLMSWLASVMSPMDRLSMLPGIDACAAAGGLECAERKPELDKISPAG